MLLALHAVAPQRARNALLLAASLLFYAWGEGEYVLLMLFSIGLNHRFGLWLHARGPRFDKGVIAFALVINLGLLGLFKYFGFAVENLRALGFDLPLLDPVHMPIGISFFTFHAISYLIDIYRGKAKAQRSVIDFALYIALFPQLVAGPIVRYHELVHQLGKRELSVARFAEGTRRFIFGLAKKMLIANTVAATATTVFKLPAGALRPQDAWLGAVCYTIQIYFDFSGYSDMAVGLGKMFGFDFPENFNYPYIAQSVSEFWRRWHITLSNWFRDYLYIPLGGNRRGRAREAFNLVTVFFLCGLWHGASWTFILWGLYHGAFLVLERVGLSSLLVRTFRPLRHLYLLLVVVIGWVLFRAPDLSSALAMLAAMSGKAAAAGSAPVLEALDGSVLLALACAAVFATPVLPFLAAHRERLRGPALGFTLRSLELGGLALLLFASCMQVAANTYNPFIYYRF